MVSPSAQFIVAAAAGWNVVVNRLLPESRYVPANLAAATTLAGVALAAGKSPQELGVSVHSAGSGLRWGLGGAAVATAAVVAGSRLPWTRSLFSDQRVDPDDVPYQTLIRIPIGTVLLEELLFRGVMPSYLEPGARFDVRSSALFGLWHVLPTLSTLDINSIDRPSSRIGAVASGVAATTAAGLVFGRLRRHTGSLLAPVLIHWAANAAAYAVAARARR